MPPPPQLVQVPHYFWFKIVESASAADDAESRAQQEPSAQKESSAQQEFGVLDAGRPPRLTEVSQIEVAGVKPKFKLVPFHGNPIADRHEAADLPKTKPAWFAGAASAHLIEVNV